MEVVNWCPVEFVCVSQGASTFITFLIVDSWSLWESYRHKFWRWGWNILWTSSLSGSRQPANYSSFSYLFTPYYSLNLAYRYPTLPKSIIRSCGEHLHVKWHHCSLLCGKDASHSLGSIRNIFIAEKKKKHLWKYTCFAYVYFTDCMKWDIHSINFCLFFEQRKAGFP